MSRSLFALALLVSMSGLSSSWGQDVPCETDSSSSLPEKFIAAGERIAQSMYQNHRLGALLEEYYQNSRCIKRPKRFNWSPLKARQRAIESELASGDWSKISVGDIWIEKWTRPANNMKAQCMPPLLKVKGASYWADYISAGLLKIQELGPAFSANYRKAFGPLLQAFVHELAHGPHYRPHVPPLSTALVKLKDQLHSSYAKFDLTAPPNIFDPHETADHLFYGARLGDSRALAVAREHFEMLREAKGMRTAYENSGDADGFIRNYLAQKGDNPATRTTVKYLMQYHHLGNNIPNLRFAFEQTSKHAAPAEAKEAKKLLTLYEKEFGK